MSEQMFGPRRYHPDYRFSMSGAHRKPAYPLGAPSITWHRGFWKDYADDPYPIDHWIDAIEELITGILETLATHRTQHLDSNWPPPYASNLIHAPRTESPVGRQRLLRNVWEKSDSVWKRVRPAAGQVDDGTHTRYETVQIEGVWKSFPVVVRIEVFEEFFTLTSSIDFSSYDTQNNASAFDSGFSRYQVTTEALNLAIDVVENRHAEVAASGDFKYTPKGSARSQLESAKFYEKIFIELWDEFQNDILSQPLKQDSAQRLGSVFADFRGLILGRDLDTTNALKLTRPRQQRISASLETRIRGIPFEGKELLQIVDSVFPLLLASEPGHAIDPSPGGSIEYTLSTFSDKRALYGSGFGPQTPTDKRRGNPLTYIILVSHDERRQIGRMVNRLHTLGSVRLASMAGFRQVLIADERLPETQRQLDLLSDCIQHFAESGRHRQLSKARKTSSAEQATPQTREEIDEAIHSLDSLLREIDYSIGGIEHRRARLEYYSERFYTLSDAMRIGRVPGYQQYDEFVRHRIGRVYARISSFARRYQDSKATLEYLRQSLIARVAEEHQRDIRAMQTVGEIFFLVVLLPYYAAELVQKLKLDLKGMLADVTPPWVTTVLSLDDEKQSAARVVLVFGLLVLIYRQRHTLVSTTRRAIGRVFAVVGKVVRAARVGSNAIRRVLSESEQKKRDR
jgi:hypothetical protein